MLGFTVAAFLQYEYSLNSVMVCPIGSGCEIVRVSPYSRFLGIHIPLFGIAFYLTMAVFSIIRSQKIWDRIIFRLQLIGAAIAVGFGIYLTYLEVFVIKALCFWCIISFIISIIILLITVIGDRRISEDRD